MHKRALTAAAAVAVIAGGGVAVQSLAADDATASCTQNPKVVDTQDGTGQRITVVCRVPKPPPVTVTATATTTVTATPTAVPTSSPTPSPTPTSSPTPTPTPTPSPTPTQPPTGCVKPDASNTGHTGTLTAYTGPSYVTTPGTVIDGKSINGDLTIAAANVTVRNTKVTGYIGVTVTRGVTIDHVTAQSAWVSSSQGVTITGSDFGFTANGDALHVTSDNGSMATDVTVTGNWIHDPRPEPGAHFDGLQVRGVNGLLVECNAFDLGPVQEQFNAPVYLEGGVQGGNSGVTVNANWLLGGAFGFMYGPDNDGKTRLTGNHFGGVYRWNDTCHSPGGAPPVQSGNDWNGAPVTPCP